MAVKYWINEEISSLKNHEHPQTLILAFSNAQQILLYQKCEENVFKIDNEWYTLVSMKKAHE